jgi:HEAT repeat protein
MLTTRGRQAVAFACLLSGLIGGCKDVDWQNRREPVTDPDRALVDARTVLLQGALSQDPMTRTHAMEAIGQTLGAEEGRLLMQGLNDPVVTVRFAAAMGLGDIAYSPAKPRLVEIVRDPNSDQRLVCAAIYGLHRLGDDSYTDQIAVILHSDVAEGRAAAALVMGKMGAASAIGPLESLLADERDPAVRLGLVEALARLGDKRSMQMLESYAKQYFLDLRLAAIPTIGEVRVPDAQRILLGLLKNFRNPLRVRVAAAGALGRIGETDDDGYKLARQSLENSEAMLRDSYGSKEQILKPEELSSLRQIAALALGRMGRTEALDVLHPFLQDEDGAVRVATGMAILELLKPTTGVRPRPYASETPAKAPQSRQTPRLHTSDGMDELESP